MYYYCLGEGVECGLWTPNTVIIKPISARLMRLFRRDNLSRCGLVDYIANMYYSVSVTQVRQVSQSVSQSVSDAGSTNAELLGSYI